MKIAPKWGKGYSRLGLAKFQMGDFTGAVKAYTEVPSPAFARLPFAGHSCPGG